MLVADVSLAPPAWPRPLEVQGREAEETLALKMSLAQWVADSGDSADSLGVSPGARVIHKQEYHEFSDSFCFRERGVTLEWSRAEEGSRHSGECVVRQFPHGLLCV